jgi:hypothetical protein
VRAFSSHSPVLDICLERDLSLDDMILALCCGLGIDRRLPFIFDTVALLRPRH